eukprot:GHVL01004048.1.p1 GENE.GHVL01004048.1~~GHVL01004048.1.p1  ORF type:complete len:202 (+),score=34.20 GHVL01004048.1:663-1268(+)
MRVTSVADKTGTSFTVGDFIQILFPDIFVDSEEGHFIEPWTEIICHGVYLSYETPFIWLIKNGLFLDLSLHIVLRFSEDEFLTFRAVPQIQTDVYAMNTPPIFSEIRPNEHDYDRRLLTETITEEGWVLESWGRQPEIERSTSVPSQTINTSRSRCRSSSPPRVSPRRRCQSFPSPRASQRKRHSRIVYLYRLASSFDRSM